MDVLSFGRVRHKPKIIRHISYALMLLWHARKSDLIFAQDASSVGFPAILASFVLGKLFLVRVPGDYAWEQSERFGVSEGMEEFQNKRHNRKIEKLKNIQRFVVRNSDAVIAPSRSFAEIIKRWTPNRNEINAIYNGIDIASIDKAAAGVSVRPKTIISAGRLVHNKGFGMLIKAMKKLPEWSLEIAGAGPERSNLEKLVETEGLTNRVRLLGSLERNELIKKIAGSEIFALNTYYETFSFQVVEALAIGTSVITTRTGSLREIITDGTNGLLVEPNSELEFLAAVGRIHGDQALKNRLIMEGKKRASDFSVESTVEAVRKIITALVQNHSSPAYKRRAKISKIVRYLFSGGMSAFTNILALYILTDLVRIWYLLSSVLAFLIAFFVSFTLQKFFTFQDHGMDDVHGQALFYLIIAGTNLLINTGSVYLFVEYAHVHYILAQIITSIFIAIESFIIYGMFIFKKPAKTA